MSDVVEVSVRVAARPSTVYRFLSHPDAFREWMGEEAKLDPAEGGEIRVAYPGGNTAAGEILEMVPERRVAWSWGFEDDAHGMPPGSTRITIDIEEGADGWSTVTLRHSGIPTAEMAEGTRAGWRHYVSAMAHRAARAELAVRMKPLVERFEAALNEPDAEARMEHLEACFEADGTFRDAAGVAGDRAELSAFIGGTHAYRPGIRFEVGGDLAQSHDWVRFDWRWVGAEGETLAEGENFARVSPAGRFRTVVGFMRG